MSRLQSRPERGMVTAETAVVLPLVAMFVLALLWLLVTVISHVQIVDAARDGARALARGEEQGAAVEHAVRTAPDGAAVSVSRGDDVVTVRVEVDAEAPSWLIVPLPSVHLEAQASVAEESDHP